jgi:hypothetical protein
MAHVRVCKPSLASSARRMRGIDPIPCLAGTIVPVRRGNRGPPAGDGTRFRPRLHPWRQRRASSASVLREGPSLLASSFTRGSFSPGPTWPERIIHFILVMASSVRAKDLLQYDHGVGADRWQRYPGVSVHHVESKRLALRREIYPPWYPSTRQDIDVESRGRP